MDPSVALAQSFSLLTMLNLLNYKIMGEEIIYFQSLSSIDFTMLSKPPRQVSYPNYTNCPQTIRDENKPLFLFGSSL